MYAVPALMILACLLCQVWKATAELSDTTNPSTIYYTEPYNNRVTTEYGVSGLSDLPGGRITRGERLLERSRSPYIVREDLFVERDGTLVVEPGVEIRFAPMIGITVRGVITAQVRTLQSSDQPSDNEHLTFSIDMATYHN